MWHFQICKVANISDIHDAVQYGPCWKHSHQVRYVHLPHRVQGNVLLTPESNQSWQHATCTGNPYSLERWSRVFLSVCEDLLVPFSLVLYNTKEFFRCVASAFSILVRNSWSILERSILERSFFSTSFHHWLIIGSTCHRICEFILQHCSSMWMDEYIQTFSSIHHPTWILQT